MQFITQSISKLQHKNYKSRHLAFLRVACSIWMLKELFFRWPLFEILYSNNSFLKFPPAHAIGFLHLNNYFLHSHHMVLIYAIIILLILNIFGIGKNIVSLFTYLLLSLLYNINNQYGNSGDEMILILFFYLCFANSFDYLILKKQHPLPNHFQKLYNLMSNLAAFSIIMNLCIGYFFAGYFKLEDHYWQNGTAIHFQLLNEKYAAFEFNKVLANNPVFFYITNYGTMAFELLFPFMVFQKRWRNLFLITGLCMHLFIYFFLLIFGMSIIFIIQYVMFFSDAELKGFVTKIKRLIPIKNKAQLSMP